MSCSLLHTTVQVVLHHEAHKLLEINPWLPPKGFLCFRVVPKQQINLGGAEILWVDAHNDLVGMCIATDFVHPLL